MRIYFLNLPFPPDPAPTGRVLQELAQDLVHRGHQVHILCSQKANDGGLVVGPQEYSRGVRVCRLPASGFGRATFWSRILDYTSFFGLLAAVLMFILPRADVIVSLTTPPYMGLLAKAVAIFKGSRAVQWVMDLYPDVLVASGMLTPGSWRYRFLQAVRRLESRSADLVLVLGPFMAMELRKYGTRRIMSESLCPERGLAPWPNQTPNDLRRERGWAPEDLVLMYSGNMGLGHPLEEFLQAALQLGPTGPRWAFVGSTGLRRGEVESFAREHPQARIQLFPAVPFARLREHLCSADVHLVSLHHEWQGLAVPSKLQGIFAVGKPVIFVGGRKNEIARWIEESGAGWVVAEHDVQALLKAIQESRDPAERARRGSAGRRFAEQHFSRANYERIAVALEELVRP